MTINVNKNPTAKVSTHVEISHSDGECFRGKCVTEKERGKKKKEKKKHPTEK